MPLKAKILLALFFIAYLSFHFYTLDLNPLPWFDEVFFASISKSLSETGNLVPLAYKEFWSQEILLYGPVHFLLESSSFKLFGFGIIQYRWITFFFGILVVITTVNLLKYYTSSLSLLILLFVSLVLDPFINLSMHEGRMDLVVTFFMLL